MSFPLFMAKQCLIRADIMIQQFTVVTILVGRYLFYNKCLVYINRNVYFDIYYEQNQKKVKNWKFKKNIRISENQYRLILSSQSQRLKCCCKTKQNKSSFHWAPYFPNTKANQSITQRPFSAWTCHFGTIKWRMACAVMPLSSILFHAMNMKSSSFFTSFQIKICKISAMPLPLEMDHYDSHLFDALKIQNSFNLSQYSSLTFWEWNKKRNSSNETNKPAEQKKERMQTNNIIGSIDKRWQEVGKVSFQVEKKSKFNTGCSIIDWKWS